MANTIDISLIVDDKGSVVVKQFGQSVDDVGQKTGTFGTRAKEAALGLGSLAGQAALAVGKIAALGSTMAAAMASVAVTASIKQFSEFEVALRDMGKVTKESFGEIQEKIMALSPALGSSTELVKGYYQVISAGVTEPKAAMDVLVVASQSAKAAHLEQSEVIKGLTKVMAGYQGEIKSASDAADLLFTIEKEGQTSFAELVPVIGELASGSHTLGVNQKELGAALALITQTAGSTSQAATQYQGVLTALMKPTTDMSKAINAMGYESAQAAIAKEGLTGVLKKLSESTGGSSEKLNKLFGDLEGLKGMVALSANGFTDFEKKIVSMNDTTGAASAAWDDYSSTLQSVWETFKNAVGKQAIMLGQELAPSIKEVLGNVVSWLEANRSLIAQGVAEWIGKMEVAIRQNLPTLQEFISYVKQAMEVVTVFGNAILKAVKWFTDFSAWLGESAAKVVLFAEKVGRLLGVIQDLGTAKATVKFEGEGSSVTPLGQKVDEMTGKIGSFADYVSSLKPVMLADFTPISDALDAIKFKSDQTLYNLANMFATVNSWQPMTGSAKTYNERYKQQLLKDMQQEMVQSAQEQAYLQSVFNTLTGAGKSSSQTTNQSISINVVSQATDPYAIAQEIRRQLKETEYRYM